MRNYKITRKTFAHFVIATVAVIIILWLTSGFSDGPIESISRIVVGFIAIWCIRKGLGEPVIANPYLLFSITPISLLLYTEKVSNYYLNHLTSSTWVISIINFIVFLVFVRYTSPKKVKQKETEGEENVGGKANSKLYITHVILLLVMGSIPRIYNAITGRTFFLASVISYFGYLSLSVAIRSKKKGLVALVLIYYVVGYISGFNKTMLIALGMTIIVGAEKYVAVTEKQRNKVLVLVVIFAVVMLGIGFPLKDYMAAGGSLFDYFRGVEIASTFGGYGSRINLGKLNYLRMPYMYLVSAWNNLQYVMETQPEHTYGLWVIKPILGYLQLDSYFESYYTLKAYSSFNTFTYITVLFKDFGLWGSVFGSALLGVFVKKVYSLYLNSESAFWTGCYAMTACATVEMFFSNHFFGLSYPFTIIIISLLYRLVFKSSRKI